MCTQRQLPDWTGYYAFIKKINIFLLLFYLLLINNKRCTDTIHLVFWPRGRSVTRVDGQSLLRCAGIWRVLVKSWEFGKTTRFRKNKNNKKTVPGYYFTFLYNRHLHLDGVVNIGSFWVVYFCYNKLRLSVKYNKYSCESCWRIGLLTYLCQFI